MTDPVIQRRYTIGEIDAIREKLKTHYLYGVYDIDTMRRKYKSFSSGAYKESEMINVVEVRVRTIMMAGLIADDLVDKDNLP